MPRSKAKRSFEESINELEVLIEEMKNSTLSVDELLKKYSVGVALLSDCRARLQAAEQVVEGSNGQK